MNKFVHIFVRYCTFVLRLLAPIPKLVIILLIPEVSLPPLSPAYPAPPLSPPGPSDLQCISQSLEFLLQITTDQRVCRPFVLLAFGHPQPQTCTDLFAGMNLHLVPSLFDYMRLMDYLSMRASGKDSIDVADTVASDGD